MEQVKMFSVRGDDVLLEYDPATADMDEVNKLVDNYEKQTGGRAFSMATGDVIKKITPDTTDVVILRPMPGRVDGLEKLVQLRS